MTASLKNEIDDSDSGFRAELTGVALADLVQLECAARSNRAFRVRSGNAVGYLYFAQGQVVHAATDTTVGEAAAVELLSWSDGTFEACALPTPPAPSIKRSYQHLLLMAAQAQDEMRRRKLVTFPKSHRVPIGIEAPRPDPRPGPPPVTSSGIRANPSVAPPPSRGEGESSSVAAYAVRLADLIGDGLGVGNVLALEVEFAASRLFARREPSGSVVEANVTSDAETAALRERLGL